jgi:DNA-binding NarL/FixJ family response regulator
MPVARAHVPGQRANAGPLLEIQPPEAARSLVADRDETLVSRGWQFIQYEVGEWRQRILVGRCSRGSSNPQRLTQREFQIAYLTALGFANKQIAAQLSLSDTFVRSIASSAWRKLGIRACTQLPAFWLGLGAVARCAATAPSFELLAFDCALEIHEPIAPTTAAERAVLSAMLRGHNNIEIGAQRSTSSRTVANQFNALFQKYRVCSKVELAAQALGVTPAAKHDDWLRLDGVPHGGSQTIAAERCLMPGARAS